MLTRENFLAAINALFIDGCDQCTLAELRDQMGLQPMKVRDPEVHAATIELLQRAEDECLVMFREGEIHDVR